MSPKKASPAKISSTAHEVVSSDEEIEDTPLALEVDVPGVGLFKSPIETLTNFSAENLLHHCYGSFLKGKGIIPSETVTWIPKGVIVKVDWSCPGWFGIYEVAFRAGSKLPFSSLIHSVLQVLKIKPFQLMPAAWRLINCVESLSAKHNILITLEDIKYLYCVRSHGKGRFGFRARNKNNVLVGGLDGGDDKGWADNFLFIKSDSVAQDLSWFEGPINLEVAEFSFNGDEAATKRRVDAFLALDAQERVWPLAAGDKVLPHYSGPVSAARTAPNTAPKPPRSRRSVVFDPKVLIATINESKRKSAEKPSSKIEEKPADKPVDKPAAKPVEDIPVVAEDPIVEAAPAEKRRRIGELSPDIPVPRFRDVHENLDAATGHDLITNFARNAPPDFEKNTAGDLAAKATGAAWQMLNLSVGVGHAVNLLQARLDKAVSQQSSMEVSLRVREGELEQERGKSAAAVSKVEGLTRQVQDLGKEVQDLNQECDALAAKMKEAALFYTLQARIDMLKTPLDDREKWSLEDEERAMADMFPSGFATKDDSADPVEEEEGGSPDVN